MGRIDKVSWKFPGGSHVDNSTATHGASPFKNNNQKLLLGAISRELSLRMNQPLRFDRSQKETLNTFWFKKEKNMKNPLHYNIQLWLFSNFCLETQQWNVDGLPTCRASWLSNWWSALAIAISRTPRCGCFFGRQKFFRRRKRAFGPVFFKERVSWLGSSLNTRVLVGTVWFVCWTSKFF